MLRAHLLALPCCFTLMAASFAAHGQETAPVSTKNTSVISAARMLDVRSGRLLENVHLLIEDGRIKQVAHGKDAFILTTDMTRYDLGDVTLLPIARDDLDAIGSLAAGAGADLLLTTGGASVGDHDLIRSALERRGFMLDFWQVAMRPGKPLLSGQLGGTPVIGLPGNPVSAYVCAVLFAVPALARLGGMADAGLQAEPALLGAAVPANDHRADHLRATLHRDGDGRLVATPFAHQDSSLLTVLSKADALVLRPPHAGPLHPGASVSIIRLHGDTLKAVP